MNNLLALPPVLQTVLSVVVAILILLATITIHEFGHYIVGKLLKFKINEFAIGMGPAIYKKTKKNGEVFSIRLFPLGGFCAFEGEDEDDQTVAKKNAREVASRKGDGDRGQKKLSKDAFNNKKPWQRILVLIAGASFNFIAAVIIVMISFTAYGHFGFAAKEVASTPSPLEQAYQLKEDDLLVAVDGKFLYFTTDLIDALNGKKKGDIVEVSVIRDGRKFTQEVALRADVSTDRMDDVHSSFDALGIATVLYVNGTEDSVFGEGSYIYRIKDRAEYESCTRVYTLNQLYESLKTLKDGESLTVYVPDGQEKKEVTLTAPVDFDLIDKENRSEVLKAFGIDGGLLYYQVASETVRFGFFEGLGRAVVYSVRTVPVTIKSFAQLISGKLPLSSVSGPVGTISMTSQYVSMGFKYMLNIASLIGLSVAIFNLLPIPALDGARAIFVLIEWIRKKPINRNVEGLIHFIGLILLIGFAILVDLLKVF